MRSTRPPPEPPLEILLQVAVGDPVAGGVGPPTEPLAEVAQVDRLGVEIGRREVGLVGQVVVEHAIGRILEGVCVCLEGRALATPAAINNASPIIDAVIDCLEKRAIVARKHRSV